MARRKVTAAPVLSDWAAVDQALRDIRECQHALTELAVDRDRRLDSIKTNTPKRRCHCRTASSAWSPM